MGGWPGTPSCWATVMAASPGVGWVRALSTGSLAIGCAPEA